MDSLRDIEKQCAAVLARRARVGGDPVACPLCRSALATHDALWAHVEAAHGVALGDIDNVADPAGLLAEVADAVAPPEHACPVCAASHATLAALLAHARADGHGAWAAALGARASRFFVGGTFGDGVVTDFAADVDADEDADAAVGYESGDDHGGDGAMFAASCFFCATHAPNLLAHLKSAHNLDLATSDLFAKHPGALCKSEYDRLKVVNYLRAAQAADQCPGCGKEGGYCGAAGHFFPEAVPDDDKWLISHVANDGALALVMALGDEEEDDDGKGVVPMVATLAEAAQRLAAAAGGTELEEPE